MTHTPGPWRVDGVPGYDAPVVNSSRRSIAKVLYDGGSEDPEVDDNAALIAIAPEMLEICKSGHNRFTSASHTLRMIAASFSENSGFSNWLYYKANQMDAAIAKAEGAQ